MQNIWWYEFEQLTKIQETEIFCVIPIHDSSAPARASSFALIIAFFVSVDRSHFSRRPQLSIAEKDRSSDRDRPTATKSVRVRHPTLVGRPRLIDLCDTKRPKCLPPRASEERRGRERGRLREYATRN